MSAIISVQNYDSLSISCLLHMLKNFDKVYFENKKPIIYSITKKYFENKESVNLYDLILYHFKFRVLEERLNYILLVLGKELDGNMNDLPMEYREDFFRVLLQFLESVEKYAKNQNGTVEWQLSNIPKLLDYLGEIEKSEITSYSLRQKINALVVKIREDFEKTKVDDVKVEGTLVPIDYQILSVEETEEKLKQIKILKLKKSKLNKGNLCDALSSFALYSDEDKDYLINYMFKHNWTECVKSIDDIVAFDYFCRNISYTCLSDRFSPFSILLGGLNKLQNTFSQSYLNSWMEYFNVNTFKDMMGEIEKWYKSFDGATDIGWICYEKLLLSHYLNNNRTYFMDSSEIAEYAKNILIKDCDIYLSFFSPYKGKTLTDWLQKIDVIEVPHFINTPKVKNGVLEEDIGLLESKKYLLSYYFEVFDMFDNKLFHYNGGFTSSDKIEYDAFVMNKDIFDDFINVLNTVTFTGEELEVLRKNKAFKWEPYGSWNNERNIKKDVMTYIQRYFCQNSSFFTKEFIKDLWYDEGHYSAFSYFTDYHNFSGAFKEHSDYSFFFFDTLKDNLNFGNITDLRLFFRLQGNYYTKGLFFNKFYEKFKSECVDCYNILNSFINENIEGQERDIIQFIKLYYENS